MRATRPLLSALALALSLAAGHVHAQSLQELYEAAHAYDASYLAARALAQSAEYKAAQADALNRPSAQLSSNLSSNQLDLPNINGESNTFNATASVRYTLYNDANKATVSQARKALLVAQSDLEIAEQDLIVRVSQAYFEVLAAQDALATTRANKAAITEQLASAKRNFEVGTATITDTREAQAKFDLGTAQEIAAENDLRTKRIALDQLVGRVGVVPKGLVAPLVLPPVSPDDAEAWVGNADTVHPQVRKARLGLEVAQLEAEKARVAGRATLDAVGSFGMANSQGRLSTSTGVSKTTTVGLQFVVPLYTGGAIENRLSEAVSLEEKSRNDVEAARRGVAQLTRQAFFGVQSGMAQVKALEAAESSTKLALEATQLGYKVGVRVNLDVLNAQTQLFQTQRDLAKARYDVILGSLRLRQASGQLKPEDLLALNALLAK